MNRLSADDLRGWLRAHGVASARRVEEVLSGFDLRQPVWAVTLEPGQALYQYIRLPSSGDPVPRAGHWFCLRGATESAVAIFGGGAGRRLHEYAVAHPLQAIEGTAAPFPLDWSISVGGRGGATQIYVPPTLLGRLRAVGPQDRW